MKSLAQILADANTEEKLKSFFVKFFHIKLSAKNFIDLYTPQILFEFKLDSNLKNLSERAKIIAQTLYYIRRLKFASDSRSPSKNICVVTKNSAIFFPTKIFSRYYNGNFDWDLAPSSPCKKLVAALMKDNNVLSTHIYVFANHEDEQTFIELIKKNLIEQLTLFDEKKEINEQNFYSIFQLWQKIFGAAVENGHKSSEYFITDIEEGKSQILGKSVLFRMSSGELIEKFLDINEYKHFWSIYEKVSNPRAVISIRQKMDRMSEVNLRRFTGEFFTPIEFANKAVEYLSRTIGNFCNGEYRIWDMAAGTGNLEFALPAEALKYSYISTLSEDDADYCRKIFPEATVFQYDYLNDDVEFFGNELALENIGIKKKMPARLISDLKNPDIKWIILINPPYATSSNASRNDKSNKSGVSETKIKEIMSKKNLKNSSRELYSQFLYRIGNEFISRQAYLAVFSKLKYISSERDQNLRDKVFKYKYECGFVFNSQNFSGCKGKFPVGFLIWNLSERISLAEQKIYLDVFNERLEKIAVKKIHSALPNELLNKWFKHPLQTKKYPPMSGALNVGYQNKLKADRIAENFLASLMCTASDFSHQNYTALLSGPYTSCGISVTPENFEKCMIIHMVRRLPKANWLNDRDQFLRPTKKLSKEFISDAVIWSLFSASNQTVSLRNVEYDGKIYRMRNNFYPFMLEEVRNWECSSPEIKIQPATTNEDRFAALWIKNNRLSVEAVEILGSAREIYKKFYSELAKLDIRKWKIEDWDAGWYQIRMSLGESVSLEKLSAKLLPQIYDLGFLRDEVKYF